MGKWAVVGTGMALALGAAPEARAWNELGHRLTVEKAVDALPKPIKSFYEKRERLLLEKVYDPARRQPRITFEVDRLSAFPFEDIPTSREAAVDKYGEEKLGEAGDLPWRLHDTHQSLTEAFRAVDLAAIDALSAELAYYAGELNVPPNLSQHGDGDLIGQQGLRERFDSRLLEAYGNRLRVNGPSAIYLDRPAEYPISIVRKAYVWTDNILLSDYMARLGVSSYDRFYYDGLWLRLESLITKLIGDAAQDVASFWFTAWTDAGKPKLP